MMGPERVFIHSGYRRPAIHQEIEPDLLQQIGRAVVDAIHGAIQPRGGFPDARAMASRISCKNRRSSSSHMWL